MNKWFPSLLAGLSTVFSAAAFANTTELSWTGQPDHSWLVNDIAETSLGTLCLAGADLDTEQTKSTATVRIVEKNLNKMQWTATAAPDKKFHQNRFVSCTELNGSYFLAEEIDTQSQANANQTYVFIDKFDNTGKRVGRLQVMQEAKSLWTVGLTSNANEVTLLVGEKGEDRKPLGLMRMIHLSSDLNVLTVQTIKNGAFFPPAKLLATEKSLYVVGPFSKSAHEEEATLAAAKLSSTGRYLWSTQFEGSVRKTTYRIDAASQSTMIASLAGRIASISTVTSDGKRIDSTLPDVPGCRMLGTPTGMPDSHISVLDCGKPPKLLTIRAQDGFQLTSQPLKTKLAKSYDLDSSVVLIFNEEGGTPKYTLWSIPK